MCSEILPLLVLVAGPLVLFLHRMGLTASLWVRGAIAVLILGILITRAPEGGFEQPDLDRVKLLLAASTAVLLWLAAPARTEIAPATFRFALFLLASSSLVVHTNFLRFHGHGAFVHDHDLAHYYLGSKYFEEIGYGELYTAVVRADAEANGGRSSVREVRDLSTNAMVSVERLLSQSDRVRERFRDERWRSFSDDLAMLRARMGEKFAGFLKDHGYNPTPVWSLFGGAITNLVPAGNEHALLALTWLDPLLLAVAFLALGWAFGTEVALLSLAYYALLFGASFSWVGGSFLRQVWFATTMIGVACLQRGAGIPAGILLAVATSLRVFPGFFVVGHAGAVMLALVRGRSAARADLRFVSAFVAAGGLLFVSTLLAHRGFADWLTFRANIEAHVSGLMSNFVGLPAWVPYGEAFLTSPGNPIDALHASGGSVARVVVAVLAVAGVAIAIRLARNTDDPAWRISVGAWPIALGLKVSAYYSTYLVTLIPAFRADRQKLALIFAFEAGLYVLGLFEVHFVMMCLFRSIIVVYLLIALFLGAVASPIGARRTSA